MTVASPEVLKRAFHSVGWFIPPWITAGFLTQVANAINAGNVDQQKLEEMLSYAYTDEHLAAMVCQRYPVTPYVREYKNIIGESIEAHFLRLDHIAVSGLLPVVEGAGRRLAQSRELRVNRSTGARTMFAALAQDCKEEAIEKNIGATEGIAAMMDAFTEFADNYLYADSTVYPLSDRTNRHGTLHGAYADGEYGQPINFYKVIGSVDLLCFVSGFRANMSIFAPSPTDASECLAGHYRAHSAAASQRPR